MYVCMYVGKPICIYVCMYVCIYVCMYVYMYVGTYMYVCMNLKFMYVCMQANLCRIISTGEYCIDTVPRLEAKMKAKILPSFEREVDFSSQTDAFMDLVAHTMGVLASGEVFRMDGDFNAMRKVFGHLTTYIHTHARYNLS